VNTLDLKRVLQRTRTAESGTYFTADWFHHNSTVYDDGSLIISGRHQSAVVKLAWPSGEIEWILADPAGWNEMFKKHLLTPVTASPNGDAPSGAAVDGASGNGASAYGGGFEWSYGQHAVEILPDFDDNPDTIDILLFDNGNYRFERDAELRRAVANYEIVPPEPYSRMVHYRINEKEKTVEQIWQFGKELGEVYYSDWQGDANLLENGNRLGVFARRSEDYGGDFNTEFIEVDENGEIIWQAYATSNGGRGAFPAYRLERRPLYTPAANDLRIGKPVHNRIPVELLPYPG